MTPAEVLAAARANAKTDDEILTIADAAATKAIQALFLTLGVDTSEPKQILEMQRDFAYLRSWRQSIDLVRTRGLGTAVMVIVTGALGLLWLTFKH